VEHLREEVESREGGEELVDEFPFDTQAARVGPFAGVDERAEARRERRRREADDPESGSAVIEHEMSADAAVTLHDPFFPTVGCHGVQPPRPAKEVAPRLGIRGTVER
jgi:hypothetical protein